LSACHTAVLAISATLGSRPLATFRRKIAVSDRLNRFSLV
jgi:hypothetical protein